MSSVVISGDTSGAITLAAPTVAGTNTATLPAATGTVMVSGNMPAFSAYANSAQTITNNSWTKVQFNTETFDTASAFDSTTNYRFTPLVAGYYQINVIAGCTSASAIGITGVSIYKNGSGASTLYGAGSTSNYCSYSNSSIIYLNGSTDYVEGYLLQSSGSSQSLITGVAASSFSGVLVRAA